VQGARLEISVPGLSQANAQRPTHPFGEVRAEVRAAVEALPRAARIGRDEPLGAAPPQQWHEIGQLWERPQLFDAPTLEVPPQSARWARTRQKQERAGIKGQLRLRAGDGGMDRGMVTGAKGNEKPYFQALGDRERAAPGQGYWFATGSCTLATDEQMRAHGWEWGTGLPKRLTVAVGEERAVEPPVTAQGYVLQSDRLVPWGPGATRSRSLWRGSEATDTQGRRRTILTSLLAETAARIPPVRADRWTIAMVCRWLKRGLRLADLMRVSPKGGERPVAVALIVYGVRGLSQAGGAWSLTALQRRSKTALKEAIFAAGVAEGRRQERTRAAAPGPPPSLLRAGG
jgi:hypothetical protein